MTHQPDRYTTPLLSALLAAGLISTVSAVSLAAQAPRTESLETALSADRDALQRNLQSLIEDPALSRAHVGLLVVASGSGEVLFSHNAERRFIAASTTKLLTAATALSRLGADHTWTTRLVATGTLAQGVLTGDFWVIGDGDPMVGRDRMDEWARSIRQAGVRRIRGDLIGDDRAFDDPVWGRGWMWEDVLGGWGAGVSALQLNPARVPAEVRPGPALGEPASLRILEPVRIPMRVEVRTGPAGSEQELRFVPRPEGGDPILDGWIPIDEDRISLNLAPPHPTLHLLEHLRRALSDAGVEVDGRIRRAGGAEQPATAALERRFTSRTLAQVLDRLLKRSDNQIAETLLKTLGRIGGGRGTSAEGVEVVEATLAGWGVEPGAIALADGSGLSRYNAIAPSALVRVLRRAQQLRGFGSFWSSLPIASVDGTLSRRFASTAASRNVRAKTGSLSGVRGLAGFVEDGDGERLVFALLLNAYDAPGDVATALEDLLVEQLALYHGPEFPEARTRRPR